MFRKTTKADTGRPTEQTPYGVLYTDTAAYAHFAEVRRVRDWLAAFLDDMEQLRISAPEAVKRIDEFLSTLTPQHGHLKTEALGRIRASLNGDPEIHLGPQLTALRLHTSNLWDYAVRCAAQDCERVTSGLERPYAGPFPRGSQEPAFGFRRASF